jgi:hypothetical protein
MSSTLSYLSLPSRCIQHLCIPFHSQYSNICHYNNTSIESDVNRKRSVRRSFTTDISLPRSLLFHLPLSLSYHYTIITYRASDTSFTLYSSLLTSTQATLPTTNHAACSEICESQSQFPSFFLSFSSFCTCFLLPFLPSSFQYTRAHQQRPPKPKQRVTQETPQKTTQTQEPQSAQRERTTSSEQRQKNTQASQVGFDQVTSTRAMHRLVGDILGSMFYVR